MKIVEKILGFLALLGLVLVIIGLFTSKNGLSEFVVIDSRADLKELNTLDIREVKEYSKERKGFLVVLEDDFHDVSYVNILNGFLTVIDTDYYDYVNILGIEILNEEYICHF